MADEVLDRIDAALAAARPGAAVERARELAAVTGARAFFGGPVRALPVGEVVEFTRTLGGLHSATWQDSLAADGYRGSPAGAERISCYVLLLVGDRAILRTEHGTDVEHPAQPLAAMVDLDVAELPGVDLVAVVDGGNLIGFELAP